MSTIQKPKLRWYQPTPGRLLVFLLVVEGILLLSERWGWFPFNQHKGYTVLIAVAAVGLFLLFHAPLVYRQHHISLAISI